MSHDAPLASQGEREREREKGGGGARERDTSHPFRKVVEVSSDAPPAREEEQATLLLAVSSGVG